jgi:hypothetical protein
MMDSAPISSRVNRKFHTLTLDIQAFHLDLVLATFFKILMSRKNQHTPIHHINLKERLTIDAADKDHIEGRH